MAKPKYIVVNSKTGDVISEPVSKPQAEDMAALLREMDGIPTKVVPATRANATPTGGILLGIGVVLAAIAVFSYENATAPKKNGAGGGKVGPTPPGGRPPCATPPCDWVDTAIVTPLTSTLVVIGDGSADLLVSQMAPFLPKGKKILSLKTGTSLTQMSDESRKTLDAFLKNRILAANPFGLSTDVFLLSHSSNVDPADLVNELRPLLTKNDPIVWVPPFGDADMLQKLQSTFAEARLAGNRVVGIVPTAVNDTPGWGKSVLDDITAPNGIPVEKRI